MANPAALLLVLFIAAAGASAHTTVVTTTTSMIRDEQCKREIQEMSKWQCVMWIASEPLNGDAFLRSAAANRRHSGEHLESCCEQLNSLSSNCRCDAVWEMMMEITGYGGVACRLQEECGLSGCGGCPGGRVGA